MFTRSHMIYKQTVVLCRGLSTKLLNELIPRVLDRSIYVYYVCFINLAKTILNRRFLQGHSSGFQ